MLLHHLRDAALVRRRCQSMQYPHIADAYAPEHALDAF
jgi:hypothetical protein